MILAPIVRGRKGEYKKELEKLARQGFVRARIDGELRSLDEEIALDKRKNHTIDVVVDRLVLKPGIEKRLEASIQTATKLTDGLVIVSIVNGAERLYSQKLACPNCGRSVPQLEPRSFSFNSPYGACEECTGLGSTWSFDPSKVIADPSKPLLDGALGVGAIGDLDARADQPGRCSTRTRSDRAVRAAAEEDAEHAAERRHRLPGNPAPSSMIAFVPPANAGREWLMEYMSPIECAVCHGKRLKADESCGSGEGGWRRRTDRHADRTRAEDGEHVGTDRTRSRRSPRVSSTRFVIAWSILSAVGLDYLSLSRGSATLSGGEAQRIRLATQIGSKLRGVLYVLDEPSIGLHPRDNDRLLATLSRLRDLGNTVLVVEHDADTILRADYVIDLGPGAGRLGGGLVGAGTPIDIQNQPDSLTGQYLVGQGQRFEGPAKRRKGHTGSILRARRARAQPEEYRCRVPAREVHRGDGRFGQRQVDAGERHPVSRAGAACVQIPREARLARRHHRAAAHRQGDRDRPGADRTNAAVESGDVHGSVHAHSRSVRDAPGIARTRLQARPFQLQCEGRTMRGVPGRRHEAHRDELPARRLCHLRCLPGQALQLGDTAGQIQGLLDRGSARGDGRRGAAESSRTFPQIQAKIRTLNDVGLGYIHLGQSATTLSGGEAQRIKLAKELSRRQTGKTFYILDEPTTGLHFEDVRRLLDVLHQLVDKGNTVLVIEHHLDVIKTADWIIDLGPEGGEGGGEIVVCGTPEQVIRNRRSHTAAALEKVMRNGKVH